MDLLRKLIDFRKFEKDIFAFDVRPVVKEQVEKALRYQVAEAERKINT